MSLADLQRRVRDTAGFVALDEYEMFTREFLGFLRSSRPTRIVSPTNRNYIFFQYRDTAKITRPLNTDLFMESVSDFEERLGNFHRILRTVRDEQDGSERVLAEQTLQSTDVDRVVYTMQQSIGCIGDTFPDANQTRKRIGQLFENLIRLVIGKVGIECRPRTVQIPLPGYPGRTMSYQLDLVFSPGNLALATQAEIISPDEIVGSVKTTSKDRIDKIFLDKFLVSKLLGRDVRVVAIFLHDVQRARRGGQDFGINSTFKTNHFLGYTLALNRLDGVYYVDPRPIMAEGALANEIGMFSTFVTKSIWLLGPATH